MIYVPRASIVLTRSNTWLGKLIRWGEKKARVNHSIIVEKGGWWPPFWADEGRHFAPEPRIIEADRVMRRGTLSRYHSKDKLVVYDIEATEEERALVVEDAARHVGRPYAVLQLFGQLIDNRLLGGRNVFRRLSKLDPLDICSELTGNAWGRVGVAFGLPGYALSPDNQDDFLRDAVRRGWLKDRTGRVRKVSCLLDEIEPLRPARQLVGGKE